MRTIFFLLTVMASAAFAQTSSTLPQGLSGAEGDTRLHPGWSASNVYVPARMCFSYDRALFPWTGGATIRRISLRRDTDIPQVFQAHKKTMKIRMSTGGFSPRRPRLQFGNMLGADRDYVLGDQATWRTVDFPSSAATPAPAAFDVQITLDRPFVCPGDAQNLQVDVIVLSNDTLQGSWAADAVAYPGWFDSGRTITLPSACAASLPAPDGFSCWPGGDLRTWLDTGTPQVTVIGLLGTSTSPPIPIGSCGLHVLPWVSVPVTSTNDGTGRAEFVWGRLPEEDALVGAKLAFQALVLDGSGPFLGVATLSDASSIEIGSGYPNSVLGCMVFEHGRNSVPANPDQVFFARRLQARVPVLRVE